MRIITNDYSNNKDSITKKEIALKFKESSNQVRCCNKG